MRVTICNVIAVLGKILKTATKKENLSRVIQIKSA